jgi:hypothetical protein
MMTEEDKVTADDKALRLRIAWDGMGSNVQVVFWDKDGHKHNITEEFMSSAGTTIRRAFGTDDVRSKLKFSVAGNGLSIDLEFVPVSRKVLIDIPESVCDQLMQIV